MNVLIVNATDLRGGAGRASYRLHKALLEEGVHSRMLVQEKRSDDITVIGPRTKKALFINKLRLLLDRIPVMFYKRRQAIPFSAAWLPFSGIVDKINSIGPDIVHLNWISEGMFRIEDFARIKVPVVWTLHDSWGFTGGCHIHLECRKFTQQCGACPVLGSRAEKDLSHKVFQRKQRVFARKEDMVIVSVSSWMNKCVRSSALLQEKRNVVLPNPIDTNLYKPFPKKIARGLWNLPTDKKLILFGAVNALGDVNKGFHLLTDALRQLKDADIEFIVFGGSEPENPYDFGHKTHYVGYLKDDISLVTLYSAVDVMVVPSLQESFGQTASEAMACMTPVVAFGTTGLLDIIDHKQNGYLAQPFETADLKAGIEWVLHSDDYDRLCRSARQKVVQSFDSRVVAGKYIALYNEVLGGR